MANEGKPRKRQQNREGDCQGGRRGGLAKDAGVMERLEGPGESKMYAWEYLDFARGGAGVIHKVSRHRMRAGLHLEQKEQGGASKI